MYDLPCAFTRFPKVMSEQKRKTTKKDQSQRLCDVEAVSFFGSCRAGRHCGRHREQEHQEGATCATLLSPCQICQIRGNSLYASGGFRFAISEQQSSAEAETCSSLTAVRSGLSLTMPFHLLIQCHLETFCHVTPPSQSLLIFSVNERQC